MNKLFTKFKVAVEVKELNCYIKIIDKRDNAVINDLTNALYMKMTENVTKDEIKSTIQQYSNVLLPNMFKEEKKICYYDVYTNEFVNESSVFDNNSNSHFVINLDEKNTDFSLDKETVHNYQSDQYSNSVFIMDVRFNSNSTKYYIEDFELWINDAGFYVKSNRDLFVEKFTEKYDYQKILSSLSLVDIYKFNGNFLYINESFENVDEIFKLDEKILLNNLNSYFDNNKILFINSKMLSNLNVDYTQIFKETKDPKLIIILKQNNYDVSNYNNIGIQTNSIDLIDGNYVLTINESLFREACGYNTQILFMAEDSYFAISKLNKKYENFVFISKVKTNGKRYLAPILNEFSQIDEGSCYLNDLLLLAFVLSDEELSRYLNFYIVNSVRLGQDNKIHYTNLNNKRKKITLDTCKYFIDFNKYISKLNKKIIFSKESINALIDEVKDIVRKIIDKNGLDDFVNVIYHIMNICDLKNIIDEDKYEELISLINIKKKLIDYEQNLIFIIDSNIFLEEPDVLTKYFKNKEVIIPQIVMKELKDHKYSSVSSLRAVRSIKIFKEETMNKISIINENDYISYNNNEELTIHKLIDLAKKYPNEKSYSIIVSNDSYLLDIADENIEIVTSDFLPLLKE